MVVVKLTGVVCDGTKGQTRDGLVQEDSIMDKKGEEGLQER